MRWRVAPGSDPEPLGELICRGCGRASGGVAEWRCADCQSTFAILRAQPSLETIDEQTRGVWRYADWLPVRTPVSLGEPETPLVAVPWNGTSIVFKVEGAQPTGSFKDRGAAAMISWLHERQVTRILTDSSGNAGASAAAYCTSAGVRCEVYVPDSTSRAKLTQLQVYGATVVRVPGPREAAEERARACSTEDGVYAPHNWSPVFVAGMQTFAFELWEQLGRTAPDVVIIPVGGGSLLLGVHNGFSALRDAGLVERVPRLIGVQSEACAPVAQAFARGESEPARVVPGTSAAEGVQLANPPRGPEVLAAVRATGGELLEIGDPALWTALRRLGSFGLYVEPTSALAAAAVDVLRDAGRIDPAERIVVPLTGSGLKNSRAVQDGLGLAATL